MTAVLADPALTDAALDAVRRYLVDVPRNGLCRSSSSCRLRPARIPRAGTAQRHFVARDVPADGVALLRVSGPFALDAPG